MNPAVIMGVSSLAQGIFGKRAANKQAKKAKEIAMYNANVAIAKAKAEQEAIEFSSKQLIKQQREFKAQQRMSIAGRGGLEAGTDLLSLIESAKNMQLDLLELERQQDIARISGETQFEQIMMGGQAQYDLYKAQGRQAMIGGILGAASELSSLGGTKPSTASVDMKNMARTQNLQMTSKYGSTIGNLIPNPYASQTFNYQTRNWLDTFSGGRLQ